jgi:glycosyltransferase involved in cell wall biosynthesis
MADYYRAADLYLHAARADTCPTTVIEALACGTPVVATAVGGIPEQVRSLAWAGQPSDQPASAADAATGLLVPPGDASALASAVAELVGDRARLERLSRNAAADAARRFDLERQADAYLSLYTEMLAERRLGADSGGEPLAHVPLRGAP